MKKILIAVMLGLTLIGCEGKELTKEERKEILITKLEAEQLKNEEIVNLYLEDKISKTVMNKHFKDQANLVFEYIQTVGDEEYLFYGDTYLVLYYSYCRGIVNSDYTTWNNKLDTMEKILIEAINENEE